MKLSDEIYNSILIYYSKVQRIIIIVEMQILSLKKSKYYKYASDF